MHDARSSPLVAVERLHPVYPLTAPFHPARRYAEYKGPIADEANWVYESVRRLFLDLDLDLKHFDSADWNPLGEIIRPGQLVVVKPNIVLHKNHSGGPVNAVITHGSVIRAVTDYVVKALQGEGRVIIGDAPLQECDFASANSISGLDEVVHYYQELAGVPVELQDFRLAASEKSRLGIRHMLTGDTAGYSRVNLGSASAHHDANTFEQFRVTNYDVEFMLGHHNREKHEYIVSRSILSADAVISLPKLKTHRKAGLSGAMKNLVGINGHKDCLPHHKQGSVANGGDEYQSPSWAKNVLTKVEEFEDRVQSSWVRAMTKPPKSVAYKLVKRLSDDGFFEGSWWGNDTLWRTILDLNRILLFWEERSSTLRVEQQRRFLTIVDAVLAGEGEGPLAPKAKPAGLLFAGFNPCAVDIVSAEWMGFDWRRMPTLSNGLPALADFLPEDISTRSSGPSKPKTLRFAPPAGWHGHIERE